MVDPDGRMGEFKMSQYLALICSLEGAKSIAKLDGAMAGFPPESAPTLDVVVATTVSVFHFP